MSDSVTNLLENAAKYLADCASFRTLVGASSQAAALEFIYTAGKSGEAAPPEAFVTFKSLDTSLVATETIELKGSVEFMIMIEADADDSIAAQDAIANTLRGKILDELWALSHAGGRMEITRIDLSEALSRSERAEGSGLLLYVPISIEVR